MQNDAWWSDITQRSISPKAKKKVGMGDNNAQKAKICVSEGQYRLVR